MRALILAIVLGVLSGGNVVAQQLFAMKQVVLLQPDEVLHDVLPAENPVEVMADYLKRVERAVKNTFITLDPDMIPASSGFIVFALKPDGASRLWLDMEPALPEEVRASLAVAVGELAPVPIREKLLVFAFQVSLKGAAQWAVVSEGRLPYPPEWLAIMKGRTEPLMVEDLVELAW